LLIVGIAECAGAGAVIPVLPDRLSLQLPASLRGSFVEFASPATPSSSVGYNNPSKSPLAIDIFYKNTQKIYRKING
jgi:hypothetical protein